MSVYKLKGTSGSVINQSFPFGNSIVLGSSASCNVQIAEAGVASRHAEICLIDGRSLLLKDLGSKAGTRVNGEPVIENFWRDTVLVGSKQSVDIAMIPLDHGIWVNHCHILEHAEAGMMNTLEVR